MLRKHLLVRLVQPIQLIIQTVHFNVLFDEVLVLSTVLLVAQVELALVGLYLLLVLLERPLQ